MSTKPAPGRGRLALPIRWLRLGTHVLLVAVRRGSAVIEHRSGRRDTVPLPLSSLD